MNTSAMKAITTIVATIFCAMMSGGTAQGDLLYGINTSNRYNATLGLTTGDAEVLRDAKPNFLVVSSQRIDAVTKDLLYQEYRGFSGKNVMVRYQPSGSPTIYTTCPVVGTSNHSNTYTYLTDYTITGSNPPKAVARTAKAVADDIIAQFRYYRDNYPYMELKDWMPGNEPEIEWGDLMDQTHLWDVSRFQDINAYYEDIHFWLNQDKLPSEDIRLWTPPLTINASIGVANYGPYGTVTTKKLNGTNNIGYDYLLPMIATYGRFAWHQYFFPGSVGNPLPNTHDAFLRFPASLRTALTRTSPAPIPSRITEMGWHPANGDDRDVGTYPAYGDYYEADLQNAISNHRHNAEAVALYLLGSDGGDPTEPRNEAARRLWPDCGEGGHADGHNARVRTWFWNFQRRMRGDGVYRTSGSDIQNIAVALKPDGTLLPAVSTTASSVYSNNTVDYGSWRTIDGIRNEGMWRPATIAVPSNTQWVRLATYTYHATVNTVRVTIPATLASQTWQLVITRNGGSTSSYSKTVPTGTTMMEWASLNKSDVLYVKVEQVNSGGYIQGIREIEVIGSLDTDATGCPIDESSSISGYVRDASNNPISDATVSTDWGYSDTSGTNGHYDFGCISDGTYQVTASKSGYASQTKTVTVGAGEGVTCDFNLAALPSITISNIYVDNITQTSARVRWTTNVASTSRVDYGTSTSYGSNVYSSSLVTSHAITLTSLSPGTTYHYKVTSTRSGYKTAVSSDKTFTTTAASGFGTLRGTVTHNDLYGYGGLMQPGGGEDLTQDQTDKPLKRIGAGTTAEGHDSYSPRVAPPPDDGIPEVGPLPGATVTVAGLSGVSGPNGSYVILGIPAGTYTATCHHPARGTLSGTVTITANGTTYKNWQYNGYVW